MAFLLFQQLTSNLSYFLCFVFGPPFKLGLCFPTTSNLKLSRSNSAERLQSYVSATCDLHRVTCSDEVNVGNVFRIRHGISQLLSVLLSSCIMGTRSRVLDLFVRYYERWCVCMHVHICMHLWLKFCQCSLMKSDGEFILAKGCNNIIKFSRDVKPVFPSLNWQPIFYFVNDNIKVIFHNTVFM